MQLQCLQGETDELNWRLPQGGLTNFLGWVEEEEEEEEKEKETQENADKDNIKDFVKDKEEYTLKGIRLDAINQVIIYIYFCYHLLLLFIIYYYY